MAQPSTHFNRARPFPSLLFFHPSDTACLRRGYEVSAYYNRLQRAGAWPPHRRRQTEIAMLSAGAVCHISWRTSAGRLRTREVRGPQICVISDGLVHECRLESDAELLVLYVERSLLRRVVRRRISGVLVANMVHHDLVVWHLTWALQQLFAEGTHPTPSMVDRIGGGLAERLVDRLNATAKFLAKKGRQLTNPEFDKVAAYMQANLKHDIHVIDFAKQTGHTPAHFSVLFRNRAKCSPYHYLKELRLLKAHGMILSGDYRLKEVALAVGYTNADHFGEVFHKYWNYSARDLLTKVHNAAANHRG